RIERRCLGRRRLDDIGGGGCSPPRLVGGGGGGGVLFFWPGVTTLFVSCFGFRGGQRPPPGQTQYLAVPGRREVFLPQLFMFWMSFRGCRPIQAQGHVPRTPIGATEKRNHDVLLRFIASSRPARRYNEDRQSTRATLADHHHWRNQPTKKAMWGHIPAWPF